MPGKDVQTDLLSIEPRYRDYNQMDELKGYVTSNMFIVTLSDPETVTFAPEDKRSGSKKP